ncbi:hypothetical protein K438DRAFT_1593694 [Mycena galopus ATCC 62051]|nr:hypothetical protein K438DRAFT_1593694 [Mycena galopus ATCC 62051]
MTAKTLSTSTLSLKFMQNAHRAKNLTEVQLERAEVKDDGEWEVAKEIRDTWGPETAQSVSYEASYLPFLFTSDASGSVSSPDAANLKGRRAFKRGREVSDEVNQIPSLPPPFQTGFSLMSWVLTFWRYFLAVSSHQRPCSARGQAVSRIHFQIRREAETTVNHQRSHGLEYKHELQERQSKRKRKCSTKEQVRSAGDLRQFGRRRGPTEGRTRRK